MRILFVTQYYYPNLAAGGPVVKIRALAELLIKRGHSVTVITVAPDGFDVSQSQSRTMENEDIAAGPQVIRLWTALKYRATTVNPAIWSMARREVPRADAIHLFGFYDLLGPVVGYHARAYGVPYVSEPMGMFVPIVRSLVKKRLYHRMFGQMLISGAARLIATSPLEKSELVQGGVPSPQIFERRNGVDLSEFSTLPSRGLLRHRLDIGDSEKVVLYLSRLTPKKNPDLLMRAFARMNLPNSRLVMVGPSEDNCLKELRQLQSVLELGNRVVFTGPLYDQDRLSAFADADLFVLPSQSENFGNAAAEAIAANVPVVITDRCGIAPFIRDRVGLVVPPETSEVVQAMERLLTDSKLSETYRDNCQRVARELSWDGPCDQMETLYAQLVREASRRQSITQIARQPLPKPPETAKRILFVSQYYMPAQQYGGPVFKLKGLAEGLVAKGHHVTVLTGSDRLGKSTRRDMVGGVEVVYLRSIARYRAVTINPDIWSYCRELIQSSDAVHLIGFYDLLGPVAAHHALRVGQPYIIEPIGMAVPMLRSLSKKRLYQMLMGKNILSGASRVIATSQQEYDQLLRLHIASPEKLVLRRNGVNLDEFLTVPPKGSARRTLGLDSRHQMVLYLGRLAPIKRVDLLIRAFAELRLPSARLVVAGPDDGNGYRAGLLKLVSQLGLKDLVIFPGPKYGEDKVALLSDADVLVLPSLAESFGNVVAEAIVAGTPVVVTENCGIAPYVRDRVGLVTGHSETGIAGALRQMLTNADLHRTFKTKCPEVAREFSWDEPVTQMEEIYTGLANSPTQSV